METSVGERIRKLRKSLKLTQTEFGRRVGVSDATISVLESDNQLSKELAERISKEYKIDLDSLISDMPKKEFKLLSESERFAEEILKKFEEKWKQENEFLKQQLQNKDEQLKEKDKQISNLSAVLVKSPASTRFRIPLYKGNGVLVARR